MRPVLEVEGKRGRVDGHVVLASEILLARGEEPLGEEKSADPKHLKLHTSERSIQGYHGVSACVYVSLA